PVATALYTTPPTSKHNQSGGVDDYSGAGDGDDSGDDSDTSSVEDTREPGAQCARVSKFFPPMGVPPTVAGGVDSIDQNPTTVDERGRVEMREGYRRQGTRGSSIDSGVCASDG
ncbi:unnamed protein product, partial [Sphacelaria rigidula]